MSKCKKCGAELSKGVRICPGCGAKNGKAIEDTVRDTINNFKNSDDYSAAFSASDIGENGLMAALCYVPFICLYPIISKTKTSSYVRFHANQGLTLFISELVLALIFSILKFLIFTVPVAGGIIAFVLEIISMLLGFACLILTVYGFVLGITGKAKSMPFFGTFKFFK